MASKVKRARTGRGNDHRMNEVQQKLLIMSNDCDVLKMMNPFDDIVWRRTGCRCKSSENMYSIKFRLDDNIFSLAIMDMINVASIYDGESFPLSHLMLLTKIIRADRKKTGDCMDKLDVSVENFTTILICLLFYNKLCNEIIMKNAKKEKIPWMITMTANIPDRTISINTPISDKKNYASFVYNLVNSTYFNTFVEYQYIMSYLTVAGVLPYNADDVISTIYPYVIFDRTVFVVRSSSAAYYDKIVESLNNKYCLIYLNHITLSKLEWQLIDSVYLRISCRHPLIDRFNTLGLIWSDKIVRNYYGNDLYLIIQDNVLVKHIVNDCNGELPSGYDATKRKIVEGLNECVVTAKHLCKIYDVTKVIYTQPEDFSNYHISVYDITSSKQNKAMVMDVFKKYDLGPSFLESINRGVLLRDALSHIVSRYPYNTD